ncbi:MAG TPA: YdcF family protein [Rhodopila sp.]|jgi:uncharacterized SAM-binding protein YcdF (DUF218 family)|nr:YdcF family protein [Rhodopila sp.]
MKFLLEALLLPPTAFVVLTAVGLLLRGRWWRFGRRLAAFSLVALVLSGMPAVSGNLLRVLERDVPPAPANAPKPQAIVVLSAEMIRTRQAPLGFRPGLLTLDRLRTAVELQHQTGLPILVSGGRVQPAATTLAEVMAQSLKDDFQTPATWLENKSSDTWENATDSAAILRAHDITSIYLVTHSWHMPRALLAFRHTGLTVIPAPTSIDDPLGPEADDFLPRASGWQASYYALHEWIGYVWYKLR